MKAYVSTSTKQTEGLAEKFLLTLSPQKESVVVGLHGELGSGKTAFVKALARILGVKQNVTSPTFVIQKNYPLKGKSFSSLVHVDAYRLKKGEDLLPLLWEEILKENALVCIEWPEQVESVLPRETKRIYFKFIDDTTREIRF